MLCARDSQGGKVLGTQSCRQVSKCVLTFSVVLCLLPVALQAGPPRLAVRWCCCALLRWLVKFATQEVASVEKKNATFSIGAEKQTKKKHINKNFTGLSRDLFGGILFMCLLPIRNKKTHTHKQLFGTHPVPGQSRKFVCVYVFFFPWFRLQSAKLVLAVLALLLLVLQNTAQRGNTDGFGGYGGFGHDNYLATWLACYKMGSSSEPKWPRNARRPFLRGSKMAEK